MDPYLVRLRTRGLGIQQEFNKFPTDNAGRMAYMQTVCNFEDKSDGHDVCVLPGFICEYVGSDSSSPGWFGLVSS